MASNERGACNGRRTTREAIASDLGIPIEEVVPKARILQDLGIDAFDLQELLEALEEEFGVASLEGDAKSLRTVSDLECVVHESRPAA